MKKKATRALTMGLAVTLILSCMVLFAGCGPANLEEYIANDQDASDTIEQYSTSDSIGTMDVDVKENTVTYTYKYNQTYDSTTLAQMKTQIETAMAQQKSTFTSVGESLEKQSGFDNVTIKIVYLNGDGSEIYSEKF